MSSRGGQANEAGSVFRRSVATYLAGHGLLGLDVPNFDLEGASPIRLELETNEATDDITCHLSSGVSAFISAKRATGYDKAFRKTVAAWIEQTKHMADDDLLVLATTELKGAIKQLPEALSRRRRGFSGGSGGEVEALDALDALLSDASEKARQRVREAARVVIVPASAAGHLNGTTLLAHFEGVLVPSGQGHRALKTLEKAFHDQAAAATGSDINDWVATLVAGEIEVFRDLSGPAGARLAAKQLSLERYRKSLIDAAGDLHLSLLAEDLPALRFLTCCRESS